MTANIDTQAPERIWVTREHSVWPTFRSFTASNLDHRNDDGTSDYPEYIRADVADARATAAWQGGIDALLDRVGDLPISEIAADDVIYAAKQLTLPTDTTALDRMIAERVREARNTAWDEAADLMDGYGQYGYAEEFRARICAARGSKEGRDG